MKPACFAIVAAMWLAGFSSSQLDEVSGHYSDMRYVEDEGDYVGTEVFIVPAMEDGTVEHFALVQFAEGVPARPQLVEVSVDGTRVEFRASFLGARDVHFSGEVRGDELIGRFAELDTPVVLRRGASMWR